MGVAAGGEELCLVVPCYNERARLRPDAFEPLWADPSVHLVLVDDGSTDGTVEVLRTMAQDRPTVEIMVLERNAGKGEAVRQGLLRARARGSSWVGYLDADLATPPAEILRLFAHGCDRVGTEVVLGSRVALLGRSVQRSAFRHYTGRGFATLASLVLAKPVYDTQCGAKLFRATPALDRALTRPFRSRWAFDVELLGRLDRAGTPPEAFWEEPLQCWHDADGSRRTVRASIRSSLELLPIWWRLRGTP